MFQHPEMAIILVLKAGLWVNKLQINKTWEKQRSCQYRERNFGKLMSLSQIFNALFNDSRDIFSLHNEQKHWVKEDKDVKRLAGKYKSTAPSSQCAQACVLLLFFSKTLPIAEVCGTTGLAEIQPQAVLPLSLPVHISWFRANPGNPAA